MKKMILVTTLALLPCLGLKADNVAPESITDFQWDSGDMQTLNQSPGFAGNPFAQSVGLTGVVGEPMHLTFSYAVSRPLQLTIRTLGPAIVSRITSKHYAIVGKMSYNGVPTGSYLEMWSYFEPATPGAPEGAYFSRTLDYSGPMARMEGTDDGRDFILPFDTTGTRAKLERIEFNLHLAGPGAVEMWSVKLVQYPDAPAANKSAGPNPLADGQHTVGITMLGPNVNYTLFHMENVPLADIRQMLQAPGVAGSTAEFRIVAARNIPDDALANLLDAFTKAGISDVKVDYVDMPPPPKITVQTATSSSLDWRSFALGMAAAGGLALVVWGIIFASRLWQRRQHERELRRMASLDS